MRGVRGASRVAPVRINRDRQHGRQTEQQRRAEAVLLDVRRQRAEPPRLRHRRLAEDLEPQELLLQVGAAQDEVDRRADRRAERRDDRTLREARRGVRVRELRAEFRASKNASSRAPKELCTPKRIARAPGRRRRRGRARGRGARCRRGGSRRRASPSRRRSRRGRRRASCRTRGPARTCSGHGPRGGQRIAQNCAGTAPKNCAAFTRRSRAARRASAGRAPARTRRGRPSTGWRGGAAARSAAARARGRR